MGRHRREASEPTVGSSVESAVQSGEPGLAASEVTAPIAVVTLEPPPPEPTLGTPPLEPAVTESPATSGSASAVLPGTGSRRAARQAARSTRRDRSRRGWVVLAAVVGLVALAVALLLAQRQAATGGAAPASDTRTQQTLALAVAAPGQPAPGGVLLAHDSAGGGSGAGILVPASLAVDVAGFGQSTFGDSVRLGDNGPAMALADSLGVTVDGTWVVTPKGLAALVDRAGGVTVDVDRDVTRANPDGSATVVIPQGSQRLDGARAATFALFRAPGEPEQVELARLSAVLQPVLQSLPESPTDVAGVLAGLGPQSRTNLKPTQLATLLAGLRSDQLDQQVTWQNLPVRPLDTGAASPSSVLDADAAAKLVSEQLAGSVPAQRAGGPVRVLVQNGVGTPGLGATARAKLLRDGFTFVNGGNAPTFGRATTLILVTGGDAAAGKRGAEVAKALGVPVSAVRTTTLGQSIADVVVVLGKDYRP